MNRGEHVNGGKGEHVGPSPLGPLSQWERGCHEVTGVRVGELLIRQRGLVIECELQQDMCAKDIQLCNQHSQGNSPEFITHVRYLGAGVGKNARVAGWSLVEEHFQRRQVSFVPSSCSFKLNCNAAPLVFHNEVHLMPPLNMPVRDSCLGEVGLEN